MIEIVTIKSVNLQHEFVSFVEGGTSGIRIFSPTPKPGQTWKIEREESGRVVFAVLIG